MHPNTQDFIVNQALLVRIAKEDNSDRECFYTRHTVPATPSGRRNIAVPGGRSSAHPELMPFLGYPSTVAADAWQEPYCKHITRSAALSLSPLTIVEPSFQLMLKTEYLSAITKLSAMLLSSSIVDSKIIPDYGNAFKRLHDFENEEVDWDGIGGQPADSSTARAVSTLLNHVRELRISRPSLTLSNSGAVSVIWKDSSRFATLKFKGHHQYSAIVLVDRKPLLTMSCPVGQLPQELEAFLIKSFKEDVTTHLPELPIGLR